ncbi:UNVERIFIED_CONTAM: hypothetical protein FKN15_014024 [Acipenser sinensis]
MDGDNQFQHLVQSLKRRRVLTEEETEILLVEDHEDMDAMEEDLLDEELRQEDEEEESDLEEPVSSFHSLHVPELTSSKKNCWLCYRKYRKEQKTLIVCMAPECNMKPLCLVKNRNCFQIWHSLEGDYFR